jgi:hypothetical protein
MTLNKYPEDHLTLLGPEVHTIDPETFYDRIVGMYQQRATGGKAREVEIKGKKIKSPTKKGLGTYEMRNQTALGERIAQFTFCKRMLFRDDFVKTACEYLICAEQKLSAFLEKKKFSVSPCLDDAMKLQELTLAPSDQKETNNAPNSD